MAATLTKTVPIQLRQPGTITQEFVVPARAPGTLELKVKSPDWLITNGLTFDFRARTSVDGVTWPDVPNAGMLTDVSPTFLKDGTRTDGPGGRWNWDGAAVTLQVEVRTTQAFTWGLQLSLADAP